MARTILLNPGPVTLSGRVRAAMSHDDLCHREPEFAALTQWINGAVARIYPTTSSEFESVMITGSGTSAVEAMLTTFTSDTRKVVVAANGVYGERMAQILEAHGKPHVVIRSEATAPVDLDGVRNVLRQDDSIRYLATVHHETTTGRLNDLEELSHLCREFDVKLLLDAVSSFGAEKIDVDRWNVAALAATANKCLHGVPGISFVLAERSMWRGDEHNATSVYLDLNGYYSAQHGDGFSPFTQSVQVAYALRAALEEFFEAGGWAERNALYSARAEQIFAALTETGVESLLPTADNSCVLRSYLLPDNVSYAELHGFLKDKGYVIYAGQGKLASTIFRIANMGDIRPEELDYFCDAVSTFLRSRRS